MNTKNQTRMIAQVSVFSALSIILYLVPGLKFPLPFLFPSWLEIQFSDMPALLAGFMMGPMQGVTVIVVKTLLKLPFTNTALVGELADLLCGITFVLVSSFIYKYKRTIKGAILALVMGCIATTITSIFANYYILVPFFIEAMGWSAILGLFNVLFPQATQSTFYLYYIFFSVIPFNLLRSIVCSLITFLLYKRLQRFFNYVFTPNKKKKQQEKETNEKQE